MGTMNAVRIHTYGGTEMLAFEQAPQPTVGAGEVLIQVHATSVNPFDCAVRAGYLTGWYQYPMPLTLGLDVAGVITEVGAGVTGFKPGDSVYARSDPGKNGAYAEFVLCAAENVAAKPRSLDYIQAAAVPHVALTAWAALISSAKISSGQTVLIHGAAGGVGHIAVQLAKLHGAKVIGTASANHLDFLKEIGVDEAVDYNAVPFESVVHNVDIVFDTVGGDTQERSWQTLKPGGILVSIVQPPPEETAAQFGVRGQFVMGDQSSGEKLAMFAGLIDSGKLKITVSHILPLDEIQHAHALIETRHMRGKIAVQVQ